MLKQNSHIRIVHLAIKASQPMTGENPPVVADEPVKSLRDNRFKFKTSGNLPTHLEEFREYFTNLAKKIQKMSTCN